MPTSTSAFIRTHLLLVPGMFALAGLLAHNTSLDRALATVFYDPAIANFPAHTWNTLELFGHHFAKSAVTMVWLMLLLVAISVSLWPQWRPQWARHRNAFWVTVIGMALGPLTVVMLKGMNAYQCPWNLREFGGGADFSSGWFVAASQAGYCFPGGHAASGFSLIALYFLARHMDELRLARGLLGLTLLVGASFSLIRMAQGAHFLSHNLWAAAICWFVAALAFLPLRWPLRRARPVWISDESAG
jgi:membrane-associated PAP2 superfamily phosphatase